jgi:Ca2+-binding EF-hand superfamily protein
MLNQSLSSDRCLGIDIATYIKFLDVPSVLGERFAKQAIEDSNDTLSEADLGHSLKSLYNTQIFHQFKLAFQLYDSDDDNLISFSDVRLLLIHTFCLRASSGCGHNKELEL